MVVAPYQIMLKQFLAQFKGNLLKGFIHNINSPLQNAFFILEFMSDDTRVLKEKESDLSEYYSEKTELLRNQFNSVFNMIHTIRRFDYLASEPSPVVLEELAEILRSVFKNDLFCKHHVDLNVTVSESMCTSFVSGNILVPVLCQLMDNALKALRTSSDKKLDVIIEPKRIKVVDTGCGFGDIDDVEELFECGVSRWPAEVFSDTDIISAGNGLFWVREVLRFVGAEVSLYRKDGVSTVAEVNFP